MSRPRYESAEDLGNEAAAREAVEAKWRCSVESLNPNQYPVDWGIHRGRKMLALAEFKARDVRHDAFGGIYLSLSKHHAMLNLTRPYNLKALFIGGFTDGYWWTELALGDNVIYGGRTVTTRDQYDEEPIVMLPTKDFRRL